MPSYKLFCLLDQPYERPNGSQVQSITETISAVTEVDAIRQFTMDMDRKFPVKKSIRVIND